MKEETKIVNEVAVANGEDTVNTETSIDMKKVGIIAGVGLGVALVIGGIKKLPGIIRKAKIERNEKKTAKAIADLERKGYTVITPFDMALENEEEVELDVEETNK